MNPPSPTHPKSLDKDFRKPKIVRLIARLNIGGPARQVCFLHQRLNSEFETVLITGRVDTGEADMSYLLQSPRGVHWIDSMSRPVRFWADLIAFCKIYDLLKREKPDILHTHTAKAGALGRVAGFLLGVPIIVHTYHGHVFSGYFGPLKTRLVVLVEKMLNWITTRIVAISNSQAQELSEVYRVAKSSKITVIPTGHDLSTYVHGESTGQLRKQLGLSADQKIVVWAGRMVPIKNVKLLAEIIHAAARDAPFLHFLIVGDGPDRPMFQDLIKSDSNFTLLGWQENMSAIWPEADIALGTSINEGTPAAFIEAMAAAKPFVSTAVGGVLDLAVNPRSLKGLIIADNGILCPASEESLLGCLVEIANDLVLAASMGRCGRGFVEEIYNAEPLARNVSKLYQSLISQSSIDLQMPSKK